MELKPIDFARNKIIRNGYEPICIDIPKYMPRSDSDNTITHLIHEYPTPTEWKQPKDFKD